MASAAARTTQQHRRVVAAALWLCYIAVGMAVFWYHDSNADEGLTLLRGWQVSLGVVPYRDFFEFYTPGSFYVLGVVFALFGPTYAAARLTAMVLLLSGGYALWLSGRAFLPRRVSYAVPFLWLLLFTFYPLINHNPLSLFAAAWVVPAVQRAQHSGSRWWYLIAGGLTGAVVWLLQIKGAAVAAAALLTTLWYVRQPWRQLGWYALGLTLSLAPLLAWPLRVLWSTVVLFPLAHYVPVNRRSYALAVFLLALYGAIGVCLRRAGAARELWILWWFSSLLLLSSLSQTDAAHLIINSSLALPVLAWSLGEVRRQPGNSSRWRWLAAAGSTAYLGALAVAYGISAAVASASGPPLTLGQRVSLVNPELQATAQLIRARVPPTAPIYAGPFLPNLYFEAQRRNPTRYSYLETGLSPESFFLDARAALAADPPALVILNYQLVEKFSYRLDNPVDAYLREHYRPLGIRGNLVFLAPADRGTPP